MNDEYPPMRELIEIFLKGVRYEEEYFSEFLAEHDLEAYDSLMKFEEECETYVRNYYEDEFFYWIEETYQDRIWQHFHDTLNEGGKKNDQQHPHRERRRYYNNGC